MQTRISCAYSHETAFCSLTRNNMLEATIWPQMIKMSCVVCLRCSQRLWTDILKTTVDVDKLKYDNCKDYILKHLFFSLWIELIWRWEFSVRKGESFWYCSVATIVESKTTVCALFSAHTVRCDDRNASWKHSSFEYFESATRSTMFNVRAHNADNACLTSRVVRCDQNVATCETIKPDEIIKWWICTERTRRRRRSNVAWTMKLDFILVDCRHAIPHETNGSETLNCFN